MILEYLTMTYKRIMMTLDQKKKKVFSIFPGVLFLFSFLASEGMAVAATERETSNLIVTQLDLKRLILFPLYFALPRIFFVYQAFIVVSPKISFFRFP